MKVGEDTTATGVLSSKPGFV